MSKLGKHSLAALAAALVSTAALARAPGIQRAIMQRVDLEGREPQECILGSAEIPPGEAAGRHFHYGVETGYVAQGEAEILVEGEPPLRVRAGESYLIPARRPHDARNIGGVPVRVIATYVVAKGKPLAEPVK